MDKQFVFSELATVLPPLVWRSKWNILAERHGLPFRRGYMQNLDSMGRGPARIRMNGRVAYRREDLIAWLNGLLEWGT